MKVIPTGPMVVREGLTVFFGALLAAFIVGQLPGVKSWIRDQWQP